MPCSRAHLARDPSTHPRYALPAHSKVAYLVLVHTSPSSQSRKEIDKVITSLSNFSPYIRHLAEAGSLLPSELPHASAPEQGADAAETEDGGGDTHRPMSAGLLAEFVASLLERDDEPRFRKALILIQVDGFDEPNPVMIRLRVVVV